MSKVEQDQGPSDQELRSSQTVTLTPEQQS